VQRVDLTDSGFASAFVGWHPLGLATRGPPMDAG